MREEEERDNRVECQGQTEKLWFIPQKYELFEKYFMKILLQPSLKIVNRWHSS